MRPLLRGGIFVLILLGVLAAGPRMFFVADATRYAEPIRTRYLALLGIEEPAPERRAREVARFDQRYADNPAMAWLHVIPGALFLVFGALQFSEGFRRRHLRLHRVFGRILIIVALGGVAFSAFYFVLVAPYAGILETLAIAVFGSLFVVSIVRAFVAIRRRDVETHRAWMTRAYAIALGVSVVRLVALALDPILTPYAIGPREIFLISLWGGFAMCALGAEVWLRGVVGEVRHRRLARVEDLEDGIELRDLQQGEDAV